MDLLILFSIICQVESGCNPNAIGDNGRSIGIAQIQYECQLDVGLQDCDPRDVRVSWAIFCRYIRKYCKGEPTLEKVARIWNRGGDPNYLKKCKEARYNYKVHKDKVWKLMFEGVK